MEVLLSEDVKWNKTAAERICKANGIKAATRQVYEYYFKKHPEFRKYVSEQCDLLLGRYEGIACYALLGGMMKHDMQAVRLFYELRGKIKKGGDVNVTTNAIQVNQLAEARDELMGVSDVKRKQIFTSIREIINRPDNVKNEIDGTVMGGGESGV